MTIRKKEIPIRIWGLLARVIAWDVMSMPPTRTAHLTPRHAPRELKVSRIWKASSRVGASTRQKNPRRPFVSARSWRTGSAKAAVFPEPVSARPITSRPIYSYKCRGKSKPAKLPCKARGMLCFWISVGVVYFASSHAWQRVSDNPCKSYGEIAAGGNNKIDTKSAKLHSTSSTSCWTSASSECWLCS